MSAAAETIELPRIPAERYSRPWWADEETEELPPVGPAHRHTVECRQAALNYRGWMRSFRIEACRADAHELRMLALYGEAIAAWRRAAHEHQRCQP